MAWVSPTTRSTGDLITAAIWNSDVVNNPIALTPAGIEFFIDGGGAVITTGVKGVLEVPFKCDIGAVRLLADQAGTIQVDIWKDTYANYPPTDADSITSSAVPNLATVAKSEDTTLTGWTTAIADGDILYYNVDASPAPASVTWVLVSLDVTRS